MFDATAEEKDHLAEAHFANSIPFLKIAIERGYYFTNMNHNRYQMLFG
jgi:hypothetical protein